MNEVMFLSGLALVWIIVATIQDIRKREIANWVSFSLIIFALGFRFFYSLFSDAGFGFFYEGLIGLGIFFILGNLLYYGRMFAGGDAKLMIALGAVLPFSEIFSINLKIFILFFLLFLFAGAAYGFIYSIILGLRNFKKFKKEFSKRLKQKKKFMFAIMFIGVILMLFGFFTLGNLLFMLGGLVFIFPYLYIYAKAVDEACMVKKVKVNELTEGDWLFQGVKIGKKMIKAKWSGLSKEEIRLIKKKHKNVLIKQGIPFTPAFLISFLILIYLWNTGLWNSFW